MSLDLWLTFVIASTALLLIPGPTVLLVLSYAISNGRSVALASATLFTILKWIGAIYLVWLGLKLLRSAPSDALGAVSANREVTARSVFGHATIITALNPKSIAFFIAFVPQFVDPKTPLLPQFAILIVTFVGLAAINVLAYALLADKLRAMIGKPAVIAWLTRAGGVALVAMGFATAAIRKSAA